MSMSKSKSSLAKTYVMMEQMPSDLDDNYPSRGPFVLGILHIFCGLFSIALGIGAICTHASGYFIAYGIWCGFIFLLSGIWAIITSCPNCKTSCLIVVSLVFAVMAACAATVQFSLGVVAAANDKGNLQVGRLSAPVTTLVPRYDIYYSKQWDLWLCKNSNAAFAWNSWGAVDVLLLIVAFIEAVVAVTTAVLGCKSICCGHVKITKQASDASTIQRLQVGPHGLEAYYNDGYDRDTLPPPQYAGR